MKDLINKITNKDRLVKLYGCSECSTSGFDTHNLTLCPKCSSKGYTINQDSQVLDIIERLCSARGIYRTHYNTGKSAYLMTHTLAIALIKLIELDADSFDVFSIDDSNVFSYKTVLSEEESNLDKAFVYLIQKLGNGDTGLRSTELLLAICTHHKIDIWASVADVLEGE